MQVSLRMDDGRTVEARPPTPDASWVETGIECPSGGHYLDVRSDTRIRHERHYEGPGAYCMACKRKVGTLVVKTDTLFGLDEDEAVARRGRVY